MNVAYLVFIFSSLRFSPAFSDETLNVFGNYWRSAAGHVKKKPSSKHYDFKPEVVRPYNRPRGLYSCFSDTHSKYEDFRKRISFRARLPHYFIPGGDQLRLVGKVDTNKPCIYLFFKNRDDEESSTQLSFKTLDQIAEEFPDYDLNRRAIIPYINRPKARYPNLLKGQARAETLLVNARKSDDGDHHVHPRHGLILMPQRTPRKSFHRRHVSLKLRKKQKLLQTSTEPTTEGQESQESQDTLRNEIEPLSENEDDVEMSLKKAISIARRKLQYGDAESE